MRSGTRLVVASSPFGRALGIALVVSWAFLRAVAQAVEGAAGLTGPGWASTVWVVVMTTLLVHVEARRRGLRELFAMLGLSWTSMLFTGLVSVTVLEVLFQAVVRMVGGPW